MSRRWIASGFGIATAAIVGGTLLVQNARSSSATYDEVAYLEIAAHWWRTGDAERITRMGSPLTFWKLQQAPALWLAEQTGRDDWIDDPIAHQADWLPWVRLSSAWLWLVALALTAAWAGLEHGPAAAALAAWLFALSPNLIAHGALATMEIPLVATTALVMSLFSRFLHTGDRRAFWLAAVACGLAFSCKFTAVLLPVLLGAAWGVEIVGGWLRCWRRDHGIRAGARRGCGDETTPTHGTVAQQASDPLPPGGGGSGRGGDTTCDDVPLLLPNTAQPPSPTRIEKENRLALWHLIRAMLGFVLIMAAANVVVTGFARQTPSQNRGAHPSLSRLGRLAPVVSQLFETPLPQDWVGFARQMQHQRSGGPGYLMGERRMTGWWYYYLACLVVKVPLSVPGLFAARAALLRRSPTSPGDRLALSAIALTLLIVSVGSSRNYGFRYILFLAPAAIVWITGLAATGLRGRSIALAGLLLQAVAVGSIHPHELSYFNALAGGPEEGKFLLADSNLDWGQGARALARLQATRPELRDVTVFGFGDTSPAHYGVVGEIYLIDAHGPRRPLPEKLGVTTPYVAVSRSLQHGPWGPAESFRPLEGLEPVAITDDHTFAIYRAPAEKTSGPP